MDLKEKRGGEREIICHSVTPFFPSPPFLSLLPLTIWCVRICHIQQEGVGVGVGGGSGRRSRRRRRTGRGRRRRVSVNKDAELMINGGITRLPGNWNLMSGIFLERSCYLPLSFLLSSPSLFLVLHSFCQALFSTKTRKTAQLS